MNKRLVFLFLLLVAQAVWLVTQYQARQRELETAPCLLVDCEFYDPRDPFRGDYVLFECFREMKKDDPRIGPNVLEVQPDRVVGFWKQGEDSCWNMTRVEVACSEEDRPGEGELRTWLRAIYGNNENDAMLRLDLVPNQGDWASFWSYYVSEETGDVRKAWEETFPESEKFPSDRIRLTAEILVRKGGSLLPRQLYLNGIPWHEAINQIRSGSFPLLPEPASEEEQAASGPSIQEQPAD